MENVAHSVSRQTGTRRAWRALRAWSGPERCPTCPLGRSGPCVDCVGRLGPTPLHLPPGGFDGFWALASYDGPAAELVKGIKYGGCRAPVGALADALAARIGPAGVAGGTIVTWVPTTAARRARRGVDHGEVLARAVAERLGLPARRLLLRAPGPPQTSLSLEHRRRGPRLRARPVPPPGWILLVDDVTTTGASLAAARRALYAEGAERVAAAVVAATPPARPRRSIPKGTPIGSGAWMR